MDRDRLDRLRAQYADAGFFDVQDPELRRIIETTRDAQGRRKAPFTGIRTLLDAPLATGIEDLDVALVGVPMDLGVSNRSGARLGPRAVRQIERIGPYHHQLRVAPVTRLRIADVGDCPVSRYSLDESLREIERYFDALVAAITRSAIPSSRPSAARGRSACCTSTRIAIPAASTTARSSIMAARSVTRCSTACSIPSARCRSASAAHRSLAGSSPTHPA
jgi:hypothetical protein